MEGQKRSIADIAHMTTLSEEEARELEKADMAGSEDYGEGYPDGNEYDPENGENAAAAGYGTATAPEAEAYKAPEEKPRMHHTDPAYTVAARPSAKDMFDFMMYHTYHNIAGIASVLIGLGAIVALIFNLINKGETMVTVLLAVIVVMFLANSPVTIWYRAKKQAELISDSANTITYTFSSVGLDMSRGKEYASYEWNRIERVIEAKNCYYFYMTKNSAFVLPKENLAGNDTGFRRILEGCGAKKCKLMQE